MENLEQIKYVFDSQSFAVLSTQKDGQPYASLLAVQATKDLKQILFLTPINTRKYENLISCPKVALLIHNSVNKTDDLFGAVSVTVTGTASPIDLGGSSELNQKNDLMEWFLSRHPTLREFATLPTTALISIKVQSFVLVSKFQDVVEIDVV